eukprot:4561013-Alexandrium_andersonii.AAC.1
MVARLWKPLSDWLAQHSLAAAAAALAGRGWDVVVSAWLFEIAGVVDWLRDEPGQAFEALDVA